MTYNKPKKIKGTLSLSWNVTVIFIYVSIGAILTSCATTPNVSDFTPKYGPEGTEVTVTGARLVSDDPDSTSVELDGLLQPDLDPTPSEIKFRVAEGSSTGFIRVTTPEGSDFSSDIFEVVESASDPDGRYTFGGTEDLMGERVEPSQRNQDVLFGILRPRWTQDMQSFADLEPIADAAFTRMNDFWDEASFQKVSFQKNYLTSSIIDLPYSLTYYYHSFQQRRIKGTTLPASVSLPTDKTLTIESDGQTIVVEFNSGMRSLAEIEQAVDDSVAAADPSSPPPTFTFNQSGSRFTVNTTLSGETKAKIELSGDAIPYLGFGDPSMYDLGDSAPILTLFGKPVADTVMFSSDEDLTINTLGDPTNISFSAGTRISITDIVSEIESAYPGEAQQRPFSVEAIVDPLDSDQRILIFKTHVDTDEDHGLNLTVSGSATGTLGIQGAGELYRYEPETFRGHLAILQGFNAYAETLPAGTDLSTVFGSARMFVGLIVNDNSFRASHSAWTFDIQGERFNVNYFTEGINDSGLGEVFSHEAGHSLGFPDLYKEESWQVGTVPNNWDVMDCSVCDAHPTSWLKAFNDNNAGDRAGAWMEDTNIQELSPPSGGGTNSWRFILAPSESPWQSTNPFSTSHPGVDVVHSLRLVPADERDVFMIENRQEGVFQADHLGAPVDFSQDIPSEGVIMYQGRRLPREGLPPFIPINLMTPYNDPLNNVGETFEHTITALNRINVEVVEKLTNPDASGGAASFSYLVEVTWGEGSFYDLAITPWDPPPWESEDIWVDSRAENDWNVYTYEDDAGRPELNGDNIEVGAENRLYARVHNRGDVDVTDPVTVIWRIAVPQVAGNVETEIGRVTIPVDPSTGVSIPARSSVVTPPQAYRPSDSNGKHVCVRAEILTVSGELNGTLNNSAQENLTQWYSEASSPFSAVTVPIQVQNPYDDRDANIRLYVPDVPKGWTVTVDDVMFRLPPDGQTEQNITIKPILTYFTPLVDFKSKGYIDALFANVEAQVVHGDIWYTYGGITASVNPVNEDSEIRLDPPVTPPNGGQPTVRGGLSTSGPLQPSLEDRPVHIRFRTRSGQEVWRSTETDSRGRFELKVPIQLLGAPVQINAFTPGYQGFAPSVSNEIVVTVETPPPPGDIIDIIDGLGGTTFAKVAASVGFEDMIRQQQAVTVLVPTDDAFAQLPDSLRKRLEADPKTGRKLIERHILQGKLSLDQLVESGSAISISGKKIPIMRRDGVISIGGAHIKEQNIQSKEGLVHVISKVILEDN